MEDILGYGDTPTARLADFIEEARIIEAINDPQNRIIMVIGDVDTGKTTLIQCLARFLAKQTDLGIVDSDIGQSHIGAPTTIAWGKPEAETDQWSDIDVRDFYFTGSLSPAGNLVPTLVGVKLITDKALSVCQKVIVDTTGFIAEPFGKVLKQFKIDLVHPHIILALERMKELKHILTPFMLQESPVIYRLKVPPRISVKSAANRIQYRKDKFESYFTDARTLIVSLNEVAIRFTQKPIRLSIEELKDRIVSFRDTSNRDIALGRVEEVDSGEKKLLLISPIRRDTRFSTLVIGATRMNQGESEDS